jgi:hypothetical protein
VSDLQNKVPHSVDLGSASPIFDTHQAAAYLRTSKTTLARLRLNGDGPKFAKAGRKIVYRRAWLDMWLDSRSFTSTSEARSRGVR